MRHLTCVMILVFAGVAGCAVGVPPEPPQSAESSVIAVRINSAFGLIAADRLISVRLLKLGADGDPTQSTRFVVATFRSRSNYCYAINVDPGDYAIGWLSRGGVGFYGFYSETQVILDGESVESSKITVKAGEVAFLGYVYVDVDLTDRRWSVPEPVRDYFKAIAKKEEDPDQSWFHSYWYRTSRIWKLERNMELSREFYRSAIDTLQGSGWDVIAQHQLDALEQSSATEADAK